jgi:hypothetical protein
MTNVSKSMLDQAIKDLEDKLRKEFEHKLLIKDNEFNTIKSDLEKKITALELKVTTLEANKSPSISHEDIKDSWAKAVKKTTSTPQQMLMINTMVNETKERERREKNVVIFGIKASVNSDDSLARTEDTDAIKKVFCDLDVNVEIKNVFKLRSSNSNPPPFVVVLKQESERNEILRKARNLRNLNNYEKVFINPDLTMAERYKAKVLRDECKLKNSTISDENFYYGIRNDKVIKIQK